MAVSLFFSFLPLPNTNPPRSYVKAHGGQGDDLRQAAWFHQGQVLFDQPSALLWQSNYVSGQGKSYGCHLFGLL